jgi:hypothetical protein
VNLKKPLHPGRSKEDPLKQIIRWCGGLKRGCDSRAAIQCSIPVPMVVVAGQGPNGLASKLIANLQPLLRDMPDLRHIHTPGELVRYLNEESHFHPMVIWCGEELPPHAQNVIETYYTKHRHVAPRLLIMMIGVTPAELVRLGRWRPSFARQFGERLIDFEEVLSTEREKQLRVFSARLERCANLVRADMEIDPDLTAYFAEVLRARKSTNIDRVIKLADHTWRAAYKPNPDGVTRITREHLLMAMPIGFDDKVKPQPGQMVN